MLSTCQLDMLTDRSQFLRANATFTTMLSLSYCSYKNKSKIYIIFLSGYDRSGFFPMLCRIKNSCMGLRGRLWVWSYWSANKSCNTEVILSASGGLSGIVLAKKGHICWRVICSISLTSNDNRPNTFFLVFSRVAGCNFYNFYSMRIQSRMW